MVSMFLAMLTQSPPRVDDGQDGSCGCRKRLGFGLLAHLQP